MVWGVGSNHLIIRAHFSWLEKKKVLGFQKDTLSDLRVKGFSGAAVVLWGSGLGLR